MPTKQEKTELLSIMAEHDLVKFRAFLVGTQDPQLTEFRDASDHTLSLLLHTAKTNAIYLGDEWQASRNVIREIQSWANPMDTWPGIVQNMFVESGGKFPLCVTCKFFREGPEGESPCMHMGATPADICCRAYDPLKG